MAIKLFQTDSPQNAKLRFCASSAALICNISQLVLAEEYSICILQLHSK